MVVHTDSKCEIKEKFYFYIFKILEIVICSSRVRSLNGFRIALRILYCSAIFEVLIHNSLFLIRWEGILSLALSMIEGI